MRSKESFLEEISELQQKIGVLEKQKPYPWTPMFNIDMEIAGHRNTIEFLNDRIEEYYGAKND